MDVEGTVVVFLKICYQNISRGTEESSDTFIKVDPIGAYITTCDLQNSY